MLTPENRMLVDVSMMFCKLSRIEQDVLHYMSVTCGRGMLVRYWWIRGFHEVCYGLQRGFALEDLCFKQVVG